MPRRQYRAEWTSPEGKVIVVMRGSTREYTHAAVVRSGDGRMYVIPSFHTSEAAASKGSLTAEQREQGARVVAVVPAVEVDATADAEQPVAARVAGACELITHAVSLGGVDTLIQHPASLTHRAVTADAKPHASVLRLSIGLEDVDDLRGDLERALRAAAG